MEDLGVLGLNYCQPFEYQNLDDQGLPLTNPFETVLLRRQLENCQSQLSIVSNFMDSKYDQSILLQLYKVKSGEAAIVAVDSIVQLLPA